MICWKCGKEINVSEVFRTSECPLCTADLHCCKACKFYAPGSHFECKETVDECIADKEKSNFCDFYRINPDIKPGNNTNKADAARNAFNALFGGGICL